MKVRAALRAATADCHKRVDTAFSRFDLATEDGYRRFLLAQAQAFLPIEAALDEAQGTQTAAGSDRCVIPHGTSAPSRIQRARLFQP